MPKTEWQFQPPGFDGKLHAVSVTSSTPSAVMVVHHGINEHIGRYREFFADMANRGIDCHAYDMRSYGKSEVDPEERGKIPSFDAVVDDMNAFAAKVVADHYADRSVPLFIVGHSLGGLIAASAAVRATTAPVGLVLLSPLMNVDKGPVLLIQSLLAGPLAALMPWARVVAEVRVEDMSQDLAVQKEYQEDPLNILGKVRMRTGQQIQVGMNALQRDITKVTMPVFAQHGDTDRCVSLKALQHFMTNIPSSDKALEVVTDGYHELLMGPQKKECFDSIAKWVLERSCTSAPARAGQSAL